MSIGTDIIEIARIKQAALGSERFLDKYFTQAERALFDTRQGYSRYPTIAANFAGKEAVAKALGTGLGAVTLADIEILRRESGAPFVNLHNQALSTYRDLNADTPPEHGIQISLSHSKEYAVAMVVML